MPQMKRILKKQIVFIFFVLIIALTCILAGKKIFSMFQTSEKNRPYDFHVPEGTTDIEAYQIPEEELEQLSTESLAETILSNAFLMQFEAYDSSKTALEMHKDLFNVYPASVFMGDTGSLALGGFVASTALLLKMPLYILIVGVIYLVEVLSVILQVSYFKITHGRRIFKMAPVHHHFEQSGWSETKVVAVFSIVTALFCLIALAAL